MDEKIQNLEIIIEELTNAEKKFFSEHMDIFINKSLFTYDDCLDLMDATRIKLNENNFGELKIAIRITCGSTSKIQKWCENFWRLVDYSIAPPEIIVYDKSFRSDRFVSEEIRNKKDYRNVNNVVVFYPYNEGYIRCLEINEGENMI